MAKKTLWQVYNVATTHSSYALCKADILKAIKKLFKLDDIYFPNNSQLLIKHEGKFIPFKTSLIDGGGYEFKIVYVGHNEEDEDVIYLDIQKITTV